HQRTAAALTAYRGGKTGLADVLAARRNEVDMRVQALQLETDTARLWMKIKFFFPEYDTASYANTNTIKDSK
ncbi:MAG: silC, partial [Herminiimonas sp.]|nr:silC [Herminiimonas sp.]